MRTHSKANGVDLRESSNDKGEHLPMAGYHVAPRDLPSMVYRFRTIEYTYDNRKKNNTSTPMATETRHGE